MNEQHAEKRMPRPGPETASYWKGCRDHQLLIQRCEQCSHLQFYPRTVCASCMACDLEWVQVSGRGTISSFTVVRHPVSKAYAPEIPYVIALVQLDEGPTMMSALCNCDPGDIKSGLAVEVVFERWTDEITIPKFQPANGA